MKMLYKSTRNDFEYYDFKTIFYNGLSDDGGLYIPIEIPVFSNEELKVIKNCKFEELCYIIFRKYVDCNIISDDDLSIIIKKSFVNFRDKEVTPIKKIKDFYILELFHGPTNSFKDIALQFIGNLYNYFLQKDNLNLNIICATSGDTGSAAIYALKNKSNIKCIVLHPDNKISNIQKKQMVTILDKNIYNIALNGTFDDCQKVVKNIIKNNNSFGTVNSINWCRILIQITYYFYSYFRICDINKKELLNFSVPTGNFGDILAGYYAKKMGLPINKLIIATNKNDILYRFYNTGIYEIKNCIETITPAMDITISSNFERLLYYLIKDTENTPKNTPKNTLNLNNCMNDLNKKKYFKVTNEILIKMKEDFLCESITDEEIKETIDFMYTKCKYLCDPHTAVGIKSMMKSNKDHSIKNICLSTAHPGKFPEIILNCIPNISDDFVPLNLLLLFTKKESYIKTNKQDVTQTIYNILF